VTRPLAGLSNTLVVILKMFLAASILWLAAVVFSYYSYSRLPIDANYDEVYLFADDVSGFIGLASIVISVVAAVVFLMWVYRAAKNIRLFTGATAVSKPGWAVAWYFVPIACLFKPYQDMREIWKASHGGDPAGRSIVVVWWLLLLGSILAWNAVGDSTVVADTVREYMRSLAAEVPADVLEIALAFVWLRLVQRVGAAYELNVHEGLLEHPPIPAGWYPDPSGQHELRYWDGTAWTQNGHDSATG